MVSITEGRPTDPAPDPAPKPAQAVADSAPDPAASRRWGLRLRRNKAAQSAPEVASLPAATTQEFEVSPTDPLVAYFQGASGAVDITALELESPALDQMREAGVVLAVPLVASGELIGLLSLGPRLSERGYSTDDRQLLDSLATHAAPAMKVGQLVQEQEEEARRRERMEQELVVAQLIQQQFLPKTLPELPGFHVTAFYRPARQVGGDFYDFIELPDGRVMVVVGDVTDKGVPAALVMASTHSLLRSAAPQLLSPGATLAQVNSLLCGDIPAHMFVTCVALVLDPATGHLEYANAGHDVPYLRTADGVVELRATGMPLGLMPGMIYEERSTVLHPGERLLLHSDGLAEAHNPGREMFGFPRVAELAGRAVADGQGLIDLCLSELDRFSGRNHEQEDDITLVVLECTQHRAWSSASGSGEPGSDAMAAAVEEILDEFELASEPGNERLAFKRVAAAVADAGLSSEQVARLKTAVAEATMNAIEHGNENLSDVPVEVRVLRSADGIVVTITDLGGEHDVSGEEVETPDLVEKLEGRQRPRGWGLFLIEKMVDAMQVTTEGRRHTVRLTVRPDGSADKEGEGDEQQL
jgi:serine phosphatase RsbU (regulator of sigma subunit)/anti-sigma regulatory factor (Ser/Thr protein kinase)